MKALSLRQPWAYAVLSLGKRVENRDWAGCSYRGPVLLHASKTLVLRDFDEEIETILDIVKPEPGAARLKMLEGLAFCHVPLAGKYHGEGSWRPAPTLPLGGIVGRARIVDVIRVADPRVGGWLAGPDSIYQGMIRWYAGGFALVLADVEPLPFIPWKGSLGLFEVPDDVLRSSLHAAHRNAGGLGP